MASRVANGAGGLATSRLASGMAGYVCEKGECSAYSYYYYYYYQPRGEFPAVLTPLDLRAMPPSAHRWATAIEGPLPSQFSTEPKLVDGSRREWYVYYYCNYCCYHNCRILEIRASPSITHNLLLLVVVLLHLRLLLLLLLHVSKVPRRTS